MAFSTVTIFVAVFVVSQAQVFPGTLWCGNGNIAKSDDQLGFLKTIDVCCRTHDHCPKNLVKGETLYGLTNNRNFTISDCECDNDFMSCLKKANNTIAHSMGAFYFDILKEDTCIQFPEDGGDAFFAQKPEYGTKVSALFQSIIEKIFG